MFKFKTVKDEKKHIQSCTDCRHSQELNNGKSAEEISREHGVSYEYVTATENTEK